MKLTKLLPLLVLSIVFSSCSDSDDPKNDPTYPLKFDKESYESPIDILRYIKISSGNLHNTVTVEDNSILEANTLITEGSMGPGQLVVRGKKKGETTVTVKDNMTSDQVKLKMKVTDSYITHKVTSSTHELFPNYLSRLLYLVKNDKKDFYIYTVDNTMDNHILVINGNYEFLIEENIPYLVLNYTDTEQVNKTYKFDIQESDRKTLEFYSDFLELGQNSERSTGSPSPFKLVLKDGDTKASFTIDLSILMPEGVLD